MYKKVFLQQLMQYPLPNDRVWTPDVCLARLTIACFIGARYWGWDVGTAVAVCELNLPSAYRSTKVITLGEAFTIAGVDYNSYMSERNIVSMRNYAGVQAFEHTVNKLMRGY